MDPDTTLNEARAAANRLLAADAEVDPLYYATLADELAERFLALDAWLSASGFLPTRWSAAVPSVENTNG